MVPELVSARIWPVYEQVKVDTVLRDIGREGLFGMRILAIFQVVWPLVIRQAPTRAAESRQRSQSG